MEKEFNLSEKIYYASKWISNANVIHEEDIKEFIKRLKEELAMGYSEEVIDKLAGDKLI